MTTNKARLRPYPQQGPITIANGVELPVERGGEFFRVRSANAEFTVRVDEDVELKVAQNGVYRFRDVPFSKLTIINDSGDDLSFQLEVGRGEVETNSVSISGVLSVQSDSPLEVENDASNALFVREAPSNTIFGRVNLDDTPNNIRSSLTNRTSLTIKNLGPNIVELGHSNSMVYGANYPLEVGESIEIKSTDFVFGVCNAGLSSTISYVDNY